jgi:hypothetical protein
MGRLRITYFILSVFLLGCDRPINEGHSKITISAPEKLASQSLSSLPANRKACFGVNVTGPGITPQPGNSCSPTSGVLAGFVELGKVIEASVPKGINRKIELFVFLQAENQNLPCPKLLSSLSATQLLNTYLVAKVENLEINAPTVSVDMTMQFPGEAQHLAAQLSLPATCTALAGSNNPPGFGVTSARASASAAGINLHGRVGTVRDNQVLTGSGVKLYVRQ